MFNKRFSVLYRTGDGNTATIGDMATKKVLLLLISDQTVI